MDELRILVPPELTAEMQKIAAERGIQVIDLMRQFIKLGMLAAMIEDDPHAALVLRLDDGTEREMFLI